MNIARLGADEKARRMNQTDRETLEQLLTDLCGAENEFAYYITVGEDGPADLADRLRDRIKQQVIAFAEARIED